ncbi:NAD-dependent epimerase/dehydratase family protein [Paracoccus aerius]|uniref:NAD-dependent epimerase/dehydratase family protein n=1 Tax=Paracoccus aerius TaxID=1915382 RepID=A0ABS1S5I7_9RHOB|nr:NAD-dependent epimerase/dehydratase family protein [Paracoccus aerius]MBL3673981.1 NAD-dependent epimerase/dehydratase family protein [Paracoccus aerius]GHG23491.1 epimerase [Paracoccus aerius]
MSGTHIFITGAGGYVGRNLIRYFTAAGARVTGLARSEASAATIAQLGATPVRGDMLTTDLAPLMAGASVLIHAAADLDHGPGNRALRSNDEGTRRVFAAAARAGITTAVHISSDSVLQDGRPLRNVAETHPLPRRPAGAYSAGKVEAERAALAAASPALTVIVLRPRMIWGRDDTTALPTLIEMVRSGRFAWISGGDYLSSTTHIANFCHAVGLALQRGRSGEVYHITDGSPRTFRETVSALLTSQKLEVPTKSVPRSLLRVIASAGELTHRGSRGRLKGPVSRQELATSAVEVTLDMSKAQQELHYKPIISWQEGLAELALVPVKQSASPMRIRRPSHMVAAGADLF